MDSWTWPQWMMAGLLFLRLLIHAVKDGEPMKDKYSFPVAIMSVAITAFLLWKGHFWS